MSCIDLMAHSVTHPQRGRKAETSAGANTGRRVGSRAWQTGDQTNSLDLGRTLTASITRQATRSRIEQRLILEHEDLHVQIRDQQPRRLIIFAIDTSDSMGDGPTARMSAALGASLAIASKSYLSRDQVSLITFRDKVAELVVPPTNSVTLLKQQLNRLPVGGSTPLSAGLKKVQQVVRQARLKNPQVTPLVVLISDGEATTSLAEGMDPGAEALALAVQLRKDHVPALIIDTLTYNRRLSLMPRLAEALGTSCHHIHDLQAGSIIALIEEA